MKTGDIVLEVSADPKLLSFVRGMVRSYLAEVGLTRERADEVVLGVDEACTNAIRHACNGSLDESFQIFLRTDEEWVEIQLVDTGTPAPPDAFKRKSIEAPSSHAEVTPGGLGVHLIYEVFDEVTFCSGPEAGNCVTMRLRRSDQRGRPGRQVHG